MTDANIEKRKRLCRDLWILWWIQFLALVTMWGLTCVLGQGICVGRHDWGVSMIPNQPRWDAVHLLLRRVFVLNAIVLYIACWWGSIKLLNRLVPMTVRFFAIALFLSCVVLLLCFNFVSMFDPLFEIACFLIVVVPVCSLLLLVYVCFGLRKSLMPIDKNNESVG